MRYLVYQFTFKPNQAISFAIDFMCNSASKLWNIANYERKEFEQLGFPKMPDWFDQKRRLKSDSHYKCLLAQSAQDLLKDLDLAWKSHFVLLQKHKNANPPYYKKEGQHTCIKYAHHSFKEIGNNIIRFSIPSTIKRIVETKYGKKISFFYIKLKRSITGIKSISFHHINSGEYKVSISYIDEEVSFKEDNGRHIGIDLGVTNLFAVYDNNGSSFIINGSSFKNTIHYFSKKIAYYQTNLGNHNDGGNKAKTFISKRISKLYQIKQRRINYLIHSSTKLIVDYCLENNVTKVVIGDLKNIKNNCPFGHLTKQQFYSVAFGKIVDLLDYKLKHIGVELIRVRESYSSQCPPDSPAVSRRYGLKNRRKKRGLYKYNSNIYNADCLGAFNILRIYYQNCKKTDVQLDYRCISNPSNKCIPVTLDFFDYFPCWNYRVGVAGRDYPSYDQLMIAIHSLHCSSEA